MRIAILSSLYQPHCFGGAERIAQRIAEGLARQGHEVLVVSLDPRANAPLERINGVNVARIRLPNLYWPFPHTNQSQLTKLGWHAIDHWNPIAAGRARREIERFGPELVQTHNLVGFSTAVWPMLQRMGVPIVHVIHDYYLLCVNSTMMHAGVCHDGQHGWCRYARALQRNHSAAVGTVVGVSQFVLDTHLRAGLFPNAAIRRVINNGYDSPPAQPGILGRSTPFHQAGRLTIGFLGKLSEVKGLRPLLSAVARLSQERVSLLIAGDGEESFVNQLKTDFPSPNIRFLGKVDAAAFFGQLDVLCVPSIWNDPHPSVVFEAFAHGVPVVGSRAGGITEMMEDGVSGVLVPPGDPQALADALTKFVDRPDALTAMRSAALEKAQRFTVSRNLTAYARLLDDVMALRRGSASGLEREQRVPGSSRADPIDFAHAVSAHRDAQPVDTLTS